MIKSGGEATVRFLGTALRKAVVHNPPVRKQSGRHFAKEENTAIDGSTTANDIIPISVPVATHIADTLTVVAEMSAIVAHR
jgi:hypothetical protein